MLYYLPAGTSEPQDFQLEDNGQPFDATGQTLGLVIADAESGAVPPTPPAVAWLDAAQSQVRVTNTQHLTAGRSYHVRFRLTDGSGQVGYVPNLESPDVWAVVALV